MRRVLAIIERDFTIVRRLKWRIAETFYFPLTSVIIWGLFTLWTSEIAVEAGFILLAVNIFWSFAYQSQSGTNMQLMEDRWTEEFRKIVTTPVRPFEYLIGKAFTATALSILSFASTIIVAYLVFGYGQLLEEWPSFLMLALITMIASFGISIAVASVVTVLGNEYGFISWSVMQLIIMLSAPFFPIASYPGFLRPIAMMIPYTWVFESIRSLNTSGTIPTGFLIKGVLLAIALACASIPLYSWAVDNARKTGKLIKIW